MKHPNKIIAAVLAFVLALVLGGLPEVAAAQQAQAPDSQNVPTAPGTTRVDPSQGPIAPQNLPEEPQPQGPDQTVPAATPAQQQPAAQQPPANPTPATQANQQPNQTEPVGAAAAEKGRTAGGAASRPAGAAIAPAKQHQMRSLLLKLGAIAGVGAAVGIVYGLSRSTPSTPPGATSTPGVTH